MEKHLGSNKYEVRFVFSNMWPKKIEQTHCLLHPANLRMLKNVWLKDYFPIQKASPFLEDKHLFVFRGDVTFSQLPTGSMYDIFT